MLPIASSITKASSVGTKLWLTVIMCILSSRRSVYNYPVHICTNCSGTVWIGTEPRASIPVPERYRSTCPQYKLSGPTLPEQFVAEHVPQNTGFWIVMERYGMSDTFTDVDRWSGTFPAPYRSKNASMDRVNE